MASIVPLARRLYESTLHRLNRRSVDSCGVHTILACRIERHEPGASIEVGSYCDLRGRLVTRLPTSRLIIGDNCFINARSAIECFESVVVGDDVLMGFDVIISDGRSHSTSWHERVDDHLRLRRTGQLPDPLVTKAVVIEDGVWVGARSMIMPGVTLGEGCTVGGGSVVTKSVPPYSIVAGNPATVVGEVPHIRGVRTIY